MVLRPEQIEHEDRVREDADHPNRKEEQEQQEELVVPVSQTVVHECAVMIELLNTPVTEVTVHCVLRSEVLTMNAHVVQVIVLMNQSFQQANKVSLLLYVARVNQSKTVEQDRERECHC